MQITHIQSLRLVSHKPTKYSQRRYRMVASSILSFLVIFALLVGGLVRDLKMTQERNPVRDDYYTTQFEQRLDRHNNNNNNNNNTTRNTSYSYTNRVHQPQPDEKIIKYQANAVISAKKIQVGEHLEGFQDFADVNNTHGIHPQPTKESFMEKGIIYPSNDDVGKRSSKFKLRLDWTKLEPQSTLASRMDQHQHNCSLPLGDFVYRNIYGLGSDLHLWGQALCNGMEAGIRIRTIAPWIYYDQEACNSTNDTPSPMTCYFPQSEMQCPGDVAIAKAHPAYGVKLSHLPQEVIDAKPMYPYNGHLKVLSRSNGRTNGIVKYECLSIESEFSRKQVRLAGVEVLFSRVSPLLQREAERQLALVFRDAGSVPDDLITVHIRWGDKIRSEMRKVTIPQYIAAVFKILQVRGDRFGPANIFLATEDPEAVVKFTRDIPKNWKVYVDQYFVEYLPHRQDNYSYHSVIAEKLHGRIGLIALGSLLVALEANDYVLTTASNWSRMINELRKGILNPRCNDCTRLIDLRASENGMDW